MFSPEVYRARRTALLELLADSDAGGLLVTDETNVRYLTGFTGDASWLFVSPQETRIVSDARFETQLAEECPGLEAVIRSPAQPLHEAVADVIKSADIPLLGFEAQSLTFSTWERLRDALGPAAPTPLDGIVEQLRVRKDSAEVAQIREAIRIAEVAFCDVFGQADPQAEERILAASLEHRIRELGGAGFSFEAIVAVGDRAALPHYRPKKRKLREDGLLLVDWGAVGPDGYCSDLTRCLLIGPHVSEEIRRVHEIVATAQRTAIEAIRPGAELKAVDAAARAVIEEAGYGPRFGHGLGHGIGLNVHEAPRLSPAGDGRLEPGMVVTVEPGIYLPGIGGIRIEDDVLVTEEGAEVLSTLPRDFADPETVRGWHPG